MRVEQQVHSVDPSNASMSHGGVTSKSSASVILPRSRSSDTCGTAGSESDESRYGAAGAGDDDLLAGGGSVEQARQVRLGLVHVHHALTFESA